jgi:glycosyltransferase involved in cell wall biosynthesis
MKLAGGSEVSPQPSPSKGEGASDRPLYEYVGEVDFAGKLAFLDQIDLLCVPTAYPEAKGIYALEALARGVPVVLPAHGSFPELVNLTGGGILVPPGNPQTLAETLAMLLQDEARRRQLGELGRQSVRDRFTDDHMAAKMLDVYRSLRS